MVRWASCCPLGRRRRDLPRQLGSRLRVPSSAAAQGRLDCPHRTPWAARVHPTGLGRPTPTTTPQRLPPPAVSHQGRGACRTSFVTGHTNDRATSLVSPRALSRLMLDSSGHARTSADERAVPSKDHRPGGASAASPPAVRRARPHLPRTPRPLKDHRRASPSAARPPDRATAVGLRYAQTLSTQNRNEVAALPDPP